jgi:MFS superfamily sulfate permease-like transporter
MVRKLAVAVGLIAIAIIAGFCAGAALLLVMIAVLPPFRPEDDDTLREFVPVALAYLTWAVTTLVVLIAAWRRHPFRAGSAGSCTSARPSR